jgi:cyclophilin family peptidyl-prolyl cis-trans isomerase
MSLERWRPRLPFLVAVLLVLVGGVAAGAVGLDRVAGRNSPPGLPTPVALASATPSPTPSPTATPSPSPSPLPTLAATPCSGARFGPPLAPQGEPPDPHRYSAPPPMEIDTTKLYEATITTPKGQMVVCLEPRIAPTTVNNFVVLARNHFYDGLPFHRVVPDFVIQGGDPQCRDLTAAGCGSGGPGYTFADEPVVGSYTIGTVAMANSGPNTNGSQFFICTGAQCATLPPKYNLFGHLVSGLDVAVRIVRGDPMTAVTVAEQQP